MRKWIHFTPHNESAWMLQMVQQADTSDYALILTSNEVIQEGLYKEKSKITTLAGFEALEIIENSFSALEEKCKDDWYFGFLNYDLKDHLYPTHFKKKKTAVLFPLLHFFRPRWVIRKKESCWQIGFLTEGETEQKALLFIAQIEAIEPVKERRKTTKTIIPSLNKKKYTKAFDNIQKEITKGNVYGLNLCIEYTSEAVEMDPATTFIDFMELSPMPFSAFVKHNTKYALCASPERFLLKEGEQITSMPMKGTASRDKDLKVAETNKKMLEKSEKERSENIMITDLVRSDLAKTTKAGSVQVEELCKIYTFPQLFQMVSTISAKLRDDKSWVDSIKESFPMGSMTGVPKLNALKLIDEYETSARGLYSGAIGYITPNKDFDFNVVIRTLFYDKEKQKISFWAGSAITDGANASDEYDECQLKIETIKRKLLNSTD